MSKHIPDWTAEAFVFSGRPNPQWIITEKQAADWISLWEQAAPSGKELQLPSRLGYTGCRLQYNKHSHWLMYNGCVSFFDGSQVISKIDGAKKMEFFLLNSAPTEPREILVTLGLI